MSRSLTAALLGLGIRSSMPVYPVMAQGLESASPDAALRCFEASRMAGEAMSNCPGTIPAEAIVMSPARFSEATVAAVAAGLEQLALTSRDARTRFSAATWLTTLGEANPDEGRPLPGVVTSLGRLFGQSQDPAVRDAILTKMHHQADVPAATRFLVDVARQDSPVDAGQRWPAPARAIEMLALMEPNGVSALRQLDASGEITNAVARRYLAMRRQEILGAEGAGR